MIVLLGGAISRRSADNGNRQMEFSIMAKRDNVTNIADAANTGTTEVAQPAADNRTLTFRRNHPGNRCSYGIDGNAGIVVFDRGLVAGTVPTTSNEDLGGMPATINLDCAMVPVKADNKTAKAEAAAAKAKEKADKAAAKAEAAALKIKEKADKAAAALAKAQAKVAAAAAPEVPATE